MYQYISSIVRGLPYRKLRTMGSSQEETSPLLDLIRSGGIDARSLTPEVQAGVIKAIMAAYLPVTKYLPGKPLAGGNLFRRTSGAEMSEGIIPSPQGDMTTRHKVIFLGSTMGPTLPLPTGWRVARTFELRCNYFFWNITSNEVAVLWHYASKQNSAVAWRERALIGNFSGDALIDLLAIAAPRNPGLFGSLVCSMLRAGEKAVEDRRKLLTLMESAQDRAATIAARICVR